MEVKLSNKVIVLGDNIDTDQIYPGRYLELVDPDEVGSHCLEGVDANIAKSFRKGEIVVAGKNFGCGSSREHAPIALKSMGVSLVVADSFARIFFRNAINLGLPLIICPGLSKKLKNGDEIAVDLFEGTISILSTNEILKAEKVSNHTMSILKAGGIKPMMKQKYGN
jgi:3-isopropylmalate dehydratase small subunit